MRRLWWVLTSPWRCLEWGHDRGPYVFDQCIRWRGHEGKHRSERGADFIGTETYESLRQEWVDAFARVRSQA